jgi:hypothetical protein
MAPFYAWFFCIYLDWKIIGISMMRNMCEFTAMSWIIYKVNKIEKFRNNLIKPTRESFKGWGEYLKITLPIGAIIYLGWTFQEIVSIFVGLTN